MLTKIKDFIKQLDYNSKFIFIIFLVVLFLLIINLYVVSNELDGYSAMIDEQKEKWELIETRITEYEDKINILEEILKR